MSDLVLPEIVGEGFKNQWIDISEDEYHLMRNAVHSGSFKHILKSPWAYKFYLQNKIIPTKQMKFGTAAHMAILEGQKFLDTFVTMPVFKGLTKDGKETTSRNAASVREAEAEWLASLPKGAKVVTQEERDDILFMLDSIMNNRDAYDILKDGIPEAKGVWRDPETGLLCCMQGDFISNSIEFLAEVKTTQDSNWPAFRRSVESLGYENQIIHYEDGIFNITGKKPRFKVWIAIESSAPYECQVYEVDPVYEYTGRYNVDLAKKRILECKTTMKFPQKHTEITYGKPSAWYENEYRENGVLLNV